MVDILVIRTLMQQNWMKMGIAPFMTMKGVNIQFILIYSMARFLSSQKIHRTINAVNINMLLPSQEIT